MISGHDNFIIKSQYIMCKHFILIGICIGLCEVHGHLNYTNVTGCNEYKSDKSSMKGINECMILNKRLHL